MLWTINSATDADASALALIGAATFLETYAGLLDGAGIVQHCTDQHSTPAYSKMLEEGMRAWVARLQPGNAPIAYACAGPASLPGASSGDFELIRIYALSRFRGVGLGRALLDIVVAEATRRRSERLVLAVLGANTRAVDFYYEHGFTKIANRSFSIGGQHCEDLVLARLLERS